jgi:hypothetical protein
MHTPLRSSLALPTQLPANLQEVCAILALGILRLRSRIAGECADTSAEGRERGDIRLHSTARQRLHANPKRKGVA